MALYGMRKFTADELHDYADANVQRIRHPKNTDDPKWLWRWAKKLRWLARRKEKARDHKARQRKAIRPGDGANSEGIRSR